MNIVNPDSLSLTLDAVNEAFFSQQPLTQLQREQVAEWIASRQGKPGSYASMIANILHGSVSGGEATDGQEEFPRVLRIPLIW